MEDSVNRDGDHVKIILKGIEASAEWSVKMIEIVY